MTDERRYDEREAGEIFALATESQQPPGGAAHTGGGLTLRELQQVGAEAGISGDRIADAARALEIQRQAQPRGRFLGVPISVSMTVELPRAVTDREWELLVAESRQMFAARGRVESHGNLRVWSNGNLSVNVEPTSAGHRLRMGTIRGDGIAVTLAAMAGGALTAIMASAVAVGAIDDVAGVTVIGLMSAFAAAAAFGYIPRWARKREEQMEYLAQRTLALLEENDRT